MKYNYQVSGISRSELMPFAELDQKAMAEQGIRRVIADTKPGFPCRISLEDVEVGEEVIIIHYKHHQSDSPYRASGPIFFRPKARAARLKVNELPDMLLHRFLSLRVYDNKGMMIEALTLQGVKLEASLQELWGNPDAGYIHVHNAGPGCFNCRIDRVD